MKLFQIEKEENLIQIGEKNNNKLTFLMKSLIFDLMNELDVNYLIKDFLYYQIILVVVDVKDEVFHHKFLINHSISLLELKFRQENKINNFKQLT